MTKDAMELTHTPGPLQQDATTAIGLLRSVRASDVYGYWKI